MHMQSGTSLHQAGLIDLRVHSSGNQVIITLEAKVTGSFLPQTSEVTTMYRGRSKVKVQHPVQMHPWSTCSRPVNSHWLSVSLIYLANLIYLMHDW